ncbi:MAG: GntR family transcriptional regulator [Eubacteriales bacterium]|nr:GntR family transcriptional regulator [Eubacteriales bacterium]
MALKYRVLAQLLREGIATHENERGYRLPTERELSERYHMSRQTVRHALELLAQEGLIQKRQGSGAYITGRQSPAAMEIAVITTFVDEYIFPSLLHDMESVLQHHGYRLRVHVTLNQVSAEREILRSLLERPVGGILVEGSKTALPTPNADLYQKLHRMHIPIVFFQGSYGSLSHIPAVTDDNYAGGCRLAQYLMEKGHRAIGGIFKSDDAQGPERYSGAVCALRDAGLPLPDHRICWYDTDQRRQIVDEKNTALLAGFLSQRLAGVTGIICYNDEIAFHLIQVLLAQGLRVPRDVAVVSFDNSYYSQISPVSITSLGHQGCRMGAEAARALLLQLQGRPSRSAVLPWELMVRDSG